jgi:predicted RND superfamily exporter protein
VLCLFLYGLNQRCKQCLCGRIHQNNYLARQKRSPSMSLKNWSIILLAYASIGIGAWTSTQVKSDFSPTTLNARSSEAYRNYEEYSKRFPSDQNGLIVSIGSDAKFDSREGFFILEELRKDLLRNKGVETAMGITSVELAQKTLIGSKTALLLPLDPENKFEKRLSKIDQYSDVTPKFLSADRTAARIMLKVDWEKVDLEGIHRTVGDYKFTEFHLIGKGVFSNEMKETLDKEVVFLPLLAGAILLFLFLIWFRDGRSLVLVASVLAINLSLLSVVFYLSGISIGLLTATTPLLILVLSFSDIVHIIYKYKRHKEDSIQDRIRQTMTPLRLPLWLTTLTTGVAFGLFFFTGIDEISEFATVTCAGIVLAYLTARFLLPVMLEVFRVRPFQQRSAFSSSAEGLVGLLKRKWMVVSLSGAFLLLIVVSVWVNFEVNVSYHQRFGEDTKIGQAFRFTDKHFDGTRAIDVVLESKMGLTEETISKVAMIEEALLEEYGCRSVFSVNTSIKRLNRFNRFGKASQFLLPEKMDEEFISDLTKYKEELGLINAMTDDQKLYRIVGRLPDIGSAEAERRNEILQTTLDELQDADHRLFISGFSHVRDQSRTRVTKLVLIGIALSLVVAMIVIGFAFRSVRIAVISFVPNLVPVGFGLTLMYWVGIELNPTTAMALSIILGLALDDTIYFLSVLKRSKDLPEKDSIELGLRENTFPASVTSIILMIGFGALMLSSIESNRNIGLLVATMLFIALISDLIILPALLRTFWNKRS